MPQIKARKGDFYEIRDATTVRAQEPGQTVAEVLIFGRIGDDIFDESVSAREFVEMLQEIEADVIVARINSPGGSVPDGVVIHNALRRHPAMIETEIEGWAASIASVIAMAGDRRRMAANSMFMVHAPHALVGGNSRALRRFADLLDKWAESMMTAFTRVMGDGRSDEVLELLTDGEDHWYTAEEARSFGFVEEVTDMAADDIATAHAIAASFDVSHLNHIPAAAAAFQQQEGVMPRQTDSGRAATRPTQITTDNQPTLAPAASAPAPAAPAAPAQQPAARTEEEIRADMQAKETERRQAIRAAFEPFAGHQGVPDLMNDCLDDMTVTADAARTQLLAKIGEGASPLGGNAEAAVQAGEDQREKRIDAKVHALLARMGAKDENGKAYAFDGANPYRGRSLGALAEMSLTEAGVDVSGQSVDEFAPRALTSAPQGASNTTSDFPVVLENTMHKLLLAGFMAQRTSYQDWVKIGSVSDFREWRRLVPGLIGGFDRKNEAGEYKAKNVPDAEKQTIQAEERGNIVVIDRRVLVNDDVDYIMTMLTSLGQAGARGIDADVYSLLAANPTLSDGTALFHADHNNLASSGGAPSVDTLVAGADAMAAQTAPGEDVEYLDITPSVAVARHSTARDIGVVINSQFDPDAANKLQRENKARGLVDTVVGTPRLPAAPWYLFADPNVAPVIEVVFLNGQQQPRLFQEEAFNSGSLKWRPTLDYGVGAIDYRGAWKNPGA